MELHRTLHPCYGISHPPPVQSIILQISNSGPERPTPGLVPCHRAGEDLSPNLVIVLTISGRLSGSFSFHLQKGILEYPLGPEVLCPLRKIRLLLTHGANGNTCLQFPSRAKYVALLYCLIKFWLTQNRPFCPSKRTRSLPCPSRQ